MNEVLTFAVLEHTIPMSAASLVPSPCMASCKQYTLYSNGVNIRACINSSKSPVSSDFRASITSYTRKGASLNFLEVVAIIFVLSAVFYCKKINTHMYSFYLLFMHCYRCKEIYNHSIGHDGLMACILVLTNKLITDIKCTHIVNLILQQHSN